MNILMISGDRALAAGKQGAFFNTLQELHTHFDRIDVICPRVSVRRYDMSVLGNVYVHPSPLPLIFQPLWVWYKGFRLWRTQKYSAFTCHNPFSNSIGALLLHMSIGVPYMLEIFHIEGNWMLRLWTAVLVRFLSGPATAVRVMNEREVPGFLTSHGVPAEKIVLVPAIYIDQSVFKPLEMPKQYDIAFVGRMVSGKGLGLFLDIVERTGLVGIAVGDGPLLSWVRRQAKRRKLKLHTPGFARDAAQVAEYLNASRLLVMTSLNEGGPRVVVEALACGVPVVATPVGIVPDILPPECIEEWNAADLADKVTNILGDEMLYARLRESGIVTAQRFERTAAIARYADAIKQIAHE